MEDLSKYEGMRWVASKESRLHEVGNEYDAECKNGKLYWVFSEELVESFYLIYVLDRLEQDGDLIPIGTPIYQHGEW